MGGSSYSHDLYRDRAATRAKTGAAVFAHTDDISNGTAARAVHKKMNPKGVKMRESRDSDTHPQALGIGIMFDVTGSMGSIPITLQKKLSGLMTLLIQKGYVAHPQILFGAIGDANSDDAPLQVGQFESGLEMEDDLGLIWLEGNGGGQHHETYELAYYWFAHHTSIDCYEKRGIKGYLFTIGDEAPYDKIKKAQVETLIGDKLEGNLDTVDVLKLVSERYNVFHIHCQQGQYKNRPEVLDPWKALLGERLLLLDDADNVAELIASTIGVCEGTDLDDVRAHLIDVGTSAKAAGGVIDALVPLSRVAALAKAGTVGGTLPDVPTPAGAGVDRL